MIEGVIFDLDGTLTKLNLDFDKIRSEIGIREGTILEYLDNQSGDELRKGYEILERHEDHAAKNAVLNDGALELIDYLEKKGIKKAIVTRNRRNSVNTFLKKFNLAFDAVVTREDAPIKPSKEPTILAGNLLKTDLNSLILIGDYKFDLISGKEAGVQTIFLSEKDTDESITLADFRVSSLDEVIKIIKIINYY